MTTRRDVTEPATLEVIAVGEQAIDRGLGWYPSCQVLIRGGVASCAFVTTHLRHLQAGERRWWVSVCPEHLEGPLQ